MGEDGQITSRHVFSIVTRFYIFSMDIPSQKERMEDLMTAQAEIN